MLEDRVVIDEVIRMIREQKVNADFAITRRRPLHRRHGTGGDDYLRERAADMKDLNRPCPRQSP